MKDARQHELVTAALAARAETTTVDFKGAFDPATKGDWLEVIKDIVAFANSGGGVVLFGVDDSGKLSGLNCQPILDFDVARLSDKLRKYTRSDLNDLALMSGERDGRPLGLVYVGPVDVPVVFTADGKYANGAGGERFAFRAGSTYFRHGAKSEPGTSDDLRQFLERRIEAVRDSWLSGIIRVVEAPIGAQVRVLAGDGQTNSGNTPVSIVDDSCGEPCQLIYADESHCHRQIDVIRLVNARLDSRFIVNQANIQDIRKIHSIEEKRQFFHKSKIPGAPIQFSDAFVDWIVRSYEKDPQFFSKARAARQALNRARVDARGGLAVAQNASNHLQEKAA
jgi:hypothetical protein